MVVMGDCVDSLGAGLGWFTDLCKRLHTSYQRKRSNSKVMKTHNCIETRVLFRENQPTTCEKKLEREYQQNKKHKHPEKFGKTKPAYVRPG
jgi:hypothetical protein